MSQICRRWFISTLKFYRKKFWSRTKSHQNVSNLPPVIYFHAQVLQKEVLESHEIAPKCSKFAAGDLFSRTSITERSFGVARNRTKMSQICRRWFISTRMYLIVSFWRRTKTHQNVPNLPPMIYFHAHVSQSKFLKAYENAPKCPKFAADDLCISTRMYLRVSLRAYEKAPKCPKFAADDLFPCACISE